MTSESRHSRSQAVWDLLRVGVALASCVVVPYQVAFEHRVRLGGSLLIYLLDLLFVVDLVRRHRLTSETDGPTLSELAAGTAVPNRRLRVWELAAALPLDALLLPWRQLAVAGVSWVLLLRLTRLLRVLPLNAVLRRWQRRSWANPGLMRILRLGVVIALVMHCVACLWFLVPYAAGFPADSWPVRAGVHDAAPTSQYLRSLYWTVVTMTTVGYGDITPARDAGYLFAIAVMLAGASMYAFVIANIASMLSNLDAAKVAFWSRVETATQYLRGRNAPEQLHDRIRDYYEYVWARYRGMGEQQLFADLPGPLRLEILLHLTRDLIDRVPLFRHCDHALRNVLLLALRPQVYAPGVMIAHEGEVGDAIHFISRGTVEISSQGGRRSHGRLESGDYFGDLSMLLGERRTASATAVSYCDVLLLARADFERIKLQYPEFREVLKTISSEQSGRRSELMLEGVVL